MFVHQRQHIPSLLTWVVFILSSPSSSCIWAESGSCRRLNGVCLFQALGVDSLLWMQWERWLCEQRQPPPHAGWLTEQTPSCTLITQHQWFSVLSLQNSGIANVILCSESFFLSEVSFFLHASFWLCVSGKTVQKCVLCFAFLSEFLRNGLVAIRLRPLAVHLFQILDRFNCMTLSYLQCRFMQ